MSIGILVVLGVIGFLWNRLAKFERRLDDLERRIEESQLRETRLLDSQRRDSPLREPPRVVRPAPVEPVADGPPTTAPMPRPAARQARPEPVLLRWLREYFTSGNLVVRVGIIVLFFGVGFLFKYAAEHTRLPIEARLAGVALAAMVLLGVGWRLRTSRPGFALALQGGAVGLLYLCVFAAFRLYQLLPPTLAFALLAGIAASSAVLALRQDAQSLALLGSAGGFLAPVLASTGTGSHVALFSYYALLDVGIVAIAWFKAWRPLNLLAFVFTFGIGTLWGVTQYLPSRFASTEPFLVLFFLLFVTTAVLFAMRRAPQLTHYVDGTLVFGTPVMALGLQFMLVRDIPYGRACSAVAAGALYLGLAWILYRARRDTLRLLVESFLALGVALLTLAIPLALDGHWTAAGWALEGVAVLWMGLRQRRWLAIVSGCLLQLASGIAYVAQSLDTHGGPALLNAHFLSAVLISAGGLAAAYLTWKYTMLRDRAGPLPSHALLGWGLAWWLYAALSEAKTLVPDDRWAGTVLLIVALTAAVAARVSTALSWPTLRVPGLLLLPWMILAALLMVPLGHPFAQLGWLGWPVSALVLLWNLRRYDDGPSGPSPSVLHLGSLWLLTLLSAWEIHWQVERAVSGSPVWADAAWALLPAAVVATLGAPSLQQRWPLRMQRDLYLGWGALGLALPLLLWVLWINVHADGSAPPLPYLPLLNPVDLSVGLVLFLLASWLLRLRREDSLIDAGWQQPLGVIMLAAEFVWLNGILLRSVHHWADVPYRAHELFHSIEVQTALSIFWTLLALGAMLLANRKGWRPAWFGGATLMAVVLVKLFLIDLAGIGTVPRIVSFIGVGLLMLVIGYYSPLPPAAEDPTP